jgi:hypothetical protein
MPSNRVLSRIERSAGVQDPHRLFWLLTQLTLAGIASPRRCRSDRV